MDLNYECQVKGFHQTFVALPIIKSFLMFHIYSDPY